MIWSALQFTDLLGGGESWAGLAVWGEVGCENPALHSREKSCTSWKSCKWSAWPFPLRGIRCSCQKSKARNGRAGRSSLPLQMS